MSVGVILAGGRATRLGPLAAQLNKSLVSIGQKPMLIRQAQQFHKIGIRDIVVVVSPGQRWQVEDVCQRAGVVVRVVVQEQPLGPGDALREGCRAFTNDSDVFVVFADTLVKDALLPLGAVAVSPAPTTRRWCTFIEGRWHDRQVQAGRAVAIGLYHFRSTREICKLQTDRYVAEMAPTLNALHMTDMHAVDSWDDVGDLGALARTRRKHFIARSFNDLSLSDTGVVTKIGSGADFRQETAFMRHVRSDQSLGLPFGDLYPRVVGVEDDAYRIEHVDLPTLAELWLYWPMRCDTWVELLDELTTTMTRHHWYRHPMRESVVSNFRGATAARWLLWNRDDLKAYTELEVNGRKLEAGWPLVKKLLDHLGPAQLVNTHGDLNFTNVLCSTGSGYFKLLDPRGTPSWLDYDLAKLRYSWHGGFPAITHGLFDVGVIRDQAWLKIWPERDEESVKLNYSTLDDGSARVLEALLFINGAALHRGDEQLAMYLRGVEVGNAALS